MKLTTTLRSISLSLAIAAIPCAGCVAGGQGDNDDAPAGLPDGQGDLLQPSDFSENGISLQGPVLQGPILNGTQIKGVEYLGRSGTATRQLELRGGELVSPLSSGTLLRGEDLGGTTLSAVLLDGNALDLQIERVVATDDPEIFHYFVTYWDGSAQAHLCGDADGAMVPALALAGRWDGSSGTPTGGDHIDDPSLFTLACRNAVLGKCVSLGYAPWRSATECVGTTSSCQVVSMRATHQACTRMMRADYCGDGTPHTQNGTAINYWDNFGVGAREEGLMGAWFQDAEWSPDGAVCIENVRWPGPANDYIDTFCPDRWSSTAFECFGNQSTFFTPNGLTTPLEGRSLLRNEFTHDPL